MPIIEYEGGLRLLPRNNDIQLRDWHDGNIKQLSAVLHKAFNDPAVWVRGWSGHVRLRIELSEEVR